MLRRRMCGFLVFGLLGLTSCGSDPGVESGLDCAGNWQWQSFESTLLSLINTQRGEGYSCKGEPFVTSSPLADTNALSTAARCHSLDLVERAYFDHQGKDGSWPTDRVKALGYETHGVAENIAAGNEGHTAEKVLNQWLDSPPHCVNLMNPRYTKSGLGHVVNDDINPDAWPTITTLVLE